MAKDSEAVVPAYIPWDTFTGFIAHLKVTAVPGRIDKSMMPSDMAGLTRGQILSTLKFLRLVDSAGATTPKLRHLVTAYETDKWTKAVEDAIPPAYQGIIGDLNLDEATQAQLDEKFKGAGVNGQMLSKSIRFYLAAIGAAGSKFSPHLLAKRKAASAPKKKGAGKPANPLRQSQVGDTKDKHPPFKPAAGTRSYPLYFTGKPNGMITVPEELNAADCNVIELQVAVLRASAGVNK